MTEDPLGGSIEDRAANGEGDEPETELFPLGSLEGDDATIKSIVKASHKVEATVSLMSAEVPITGSGLLNPEREGMLLVTFEAAGNTLVPVRKADSTGQKKITGWKVRQQLRPIFVEAVDGEAGAIEASFAALMAADPSAAGALLDALSRRASRHLASV